IVPCFAVVAAITIRYENIDTNFIVALQQVQRANISFAIGQLTYKRVMLNKQLDDKTGVGWFFIGALIVASACEALFGDLNKFPSTSPE
ncbi:EamA family transporter, partial [Pseudoalteromonas sp. S1610]